MICSEKYSVDMVHQEVINIRERSEKHPVILFDGDCTFCNFWVQYVLKRDKNRQFYFSSLQSDVTKDFIFSLDKRFQETDSILVCFKKEVYDKSDAVFVILKELHHPARYLWYITPKFLRNAVYDLIARYRHRLHWWQTECVIPDEAVKQRFL
jgi:predicted DCC family thiol-disulfide oxidoreductase YuxK